MTGAVSRLPEGGLLELALPELGVVHLILADGRYLVGHSGNPSSPTQPVSRYEPGADRLSPRALERIRGALAGVGFEALPPEVPGGPLPEGAVLPGDGVVEQLRVELTARVGDGEHVVAVQGHPGVPASLGPLEPLIRVLDEEVFGTWQQE